MSRSATSQSPKQLQQFALPCIHCRNKEARYLSHGSLPNMNRNQPQLAVLGKKQRRVLRNSEAAILTSDLKPDDLPQVDGYCCGHSYLKLSDATGCVCLCLQCQEMNCDGSLLVMRGGNSRKTSLKRGGHGNSKKKQQQQHRTTLSEENLDDMKNDSSSYPRTSFSTASAPASVPEKKVCSTSSN